MLEIIVYNVIVLIKYISFCLQMETELEKLRLENTLKEKE